MATEKHTTNELPKGFTLSLALVDAIPVVLFCLSAIVFGRQMQSGLFVAGSVIAFLGGAGKVAWKLLIAVSKRNVGLLNKQMRYVMPLGFLLMALGVALAWQQATSTVMGLFALPSCVFMVAWLACMAAMSYLAGHRNQASARDNWIEQGINALGQAALLAALLLAR